MRFPNGRPYCTPTNRSAAPPARIATSAVPRPPYWLSAQRPAARVRLNLRRAVTDELGDVSRADDHCIDSGSLELLDLFSARDRHVRDRELACGNVRQKLERATQSFLLVPVPRRQEEDLRIESLQCELELLLVSHFDDAIEPELDGLRMSPRA